MKCFDCSKSALLACDLSRGRNEAYLGLVERMIPRIAKTESKSCYSMKLAFFSSLNRLVNQKTQHVDYITLIRRQLGNHTQVVSPATEPSPFH